MGLIIMANTWIRTKAHSSEFAAFLDYLDFASHTKCEFDINAGLNLKNPSILLALQPSVDHGLLHDPPPQVPV
jgi:hypothetical protein